MAQGAAQAGVLCRLSVALPDRLPGQGAAHPLHTALGEQLAALAGAGNAGAGLLERILGAPGQAFLQTVFKVFEKPSNQDVVNAGLDAVAAYFAAVRPEGRVDATIEALQRDAEDWLENADAMQPLRAMNGLDDAQLRALRVLSGLSYGLVRPVFGDSTAIGSLMRKKLQPVLAPLREELSQLAG